MPPACAGGYMNLKILRQYLAVLIVTILFRAPVGYGGEATSKTVMPLRGGLDSSQRVDIEMLRRVSTTLQKSGKNLILEGTRGEKEIALFQKAAPGVVFILAGKDAIGSGGIISRDGDVITNWHVVRGNSQIVV